MEYDEIIRTVNDHDLNLEINYQAGGNRCSTKWNINKISLSQISLRNNEEIKSREERIKEIENFKNCENSSMKGEIDRRLKYKYAYSNSVNVPTKLSVTDLKLLKKEKLERVNYKIPVLRDIPQFKEGESDFTKAEIGTIVHFVMQHLNIRESLTVDNIKFQMEEMIDKKLLSEKEKEVVDVEMLHNFFLTDIGRRMKASNYVKRESSFVIKKNAHEIMPSLDRNDIILIQGIIDCYFYEDDQVVIIDYKTDEIIGGDTEAAKNEYSTQILSYKEAVEKITGKTVRACYLYLFDIGQAIEIS